MKPTARILTGLIAVAVGFSVVAARADRPNGFNASQNEGGKGRTAGASDEQAQRRSDDLLKRARQALAENDLKAADLLITQAESLGVEYSPLYFGDTPQKARRDLDRRLHSEGRTPVASGQLLPPILARQPKSPPTDPFTDRKSRQSHSAGLGESKTAAKSCILNARRELSRGNLAGATQWYYKAVGQDATFGANEDSPEKLAADIRKMGGQLSGAAVTPLPPTDQVTRVPPAADRRNSASDSTGQQPKEGHAAAGRLLLEARRALAYGDVRRATALIEQAKSLNINYGPADDTPERVETQVTAYRELKADEPQRGRTESYRRQYARILMEQAEGLLRWQDYDEAERLATEAARQHVTYSPFEPNPKNLLNRISAMRSQHRSPISSAAGAARLPSQAAKQKAVELVRQARAALGSGDLRRAEQLAHQAMAVGVPDSNFGPDEDRPSLVVLDVQKVREKGPAGMTTSGQQVAPATGSANVDNRATRALYDQRNDPTKNVLAGNQEPARSPNTPTPAPSQAGEAMPGNTGQPTVGMDLYQRGDAALRNHDPQTALEYFRQAAKHMNELDPITAQRLQDHLQILSAPAPSGGNLADEAAAEQQILARQVNAEVAIREGKARKLVEKDPKAAMAVLEETRQKVEAAGLEPAAEKQLLRRVDRSLSDVRKYIEENRPRIELEEKNRQVVQDIAQEQELKLKIQEKLAQMVDKYNDLMREQRFAEAEVVAKRAAELDPENPLSQQLVVTAKLIRRHMNNLSVQSAKEGGFYDAMARVDESAIPFDDAIPLVFPDAKQWQELSESRRRWTQEGKRHRSEREMEIEQKLKTPVSLQFQNAPLSTVLDYLAKLAEVNLYIDPQGLSEEGITTDTPVSIDLRQEIKLESALNLILQPLHLSFVIRDEVLKITSEQLRDGAVYARTYNVADLVVPIPNFAPSPSMGLAGAYQDGLGNVGFGNNGPFGSGGSAPLAVVASRNGGDSSGSINPAVMAQMSGATPKGMPTNMPMGSGPGGLGGGAMADFDSLIELITTTIAPTTWDEVGGPGSVAPFETNLSLVISQTQEVHEQIADLLEQLRRMQDLQVTIEVRFITLNDNFFERIGVDFDFDIDDNVDRPYQIFGRPPVAGEGDDGGDDGGDDDEDRFITGPFPVGRAIARDVRDHDHLNDSLTVGMSAPGFFSADLDIPFSQGSFGLATPQFGGFDPGSAASIGFAILSDIEAFFFIEAAQGDKRSNVLQAPKVTLFNGQQAFVSDTSQSPFVISVIPVVGDFAAAQQPVIVVLSEGTFLTVQAVVSSDRRFVRLTVVPFFSQIGNVDTFTFTGSETTTEDTSEEGLQDEPNDNTKKSSLKRTVREGTTVQLPTFSFVTVTTTVSVPDGGTVLLGGIKRLSEGRNEFGVPLLNKIPYINRLFRNVGIGRETQSLMMMVTPRIIIQEEEEERLGIGGP